MAEYQWIDGVKHKKCSKCGELYPETDFYLRRKGERPRMAECRWCMAERNHEYKIQRRKSSKRWDPKLYHYGCFLQPGQKWTIREKPARSLPLEYLWRGHSLIPLYKDCFGR